MSYGDITPEGYLERANGYLKALEVLKDNLSKATIPPIGLLASQAIELALKALMLHNGATENELRAVGHDLESAWAESSARGLGLGSTPPFSIQVLSLSHDSPFLFRYPQEKVLVAITDPNRLYRDVKSLVEAVRKKIGCL